MMVSPGRVIESPGTGHWLLAVHPRSQHTVAQLYLGQPGRLDQWLLLLTSASYVREAEDCWLDWSPTGYRFWNRLFGVENYQQLGQQFQAQVVQPSNQLRWQRTPETDWLFNPQQPSEAVFTRRALNAE